MGTVIPRSDGSTGSQAQILSAMARLFIGRQGLNRALSRFAATLSQAARAIFFRLQTLSSKEGLSGKFRKDLCNI